MDLLLNNARFRWLFGSFCFSMAGMSMFYMVQPWLALELTDSPLWVGATAGANGAGLLAFGVLGGVLADRVERRKLAMGSLLARAANAAALAGLALTGHAEIGHVLVAAFLDGAAVAVEVPAESALVLDVAGRGRLLRGMSASFAAGGVIYIVGPLVAGVIVTSHPTGVVYAVASGAFAAAVAAMWRLGGRVGRGRATTRGSALRDLGDVVRFIRGAPAVRGLILMMLLVETFGWAHESMLSIMARDVLKIGPSGLGRLLAAGGAGSLGASLLLTSFRDVRAKGRLMVAAAGGFGLGLSLFAASPWPALSMLLLGTAYGLASIYEATTETLLQMVVPDEMRGRVLGLRSLVWGVVGVGGLQTGAIATVLGAPVGIAVGGGVVVLVALAMTTVAPRLDRAAARSERTS